MKGEKSVIVETLLVFANNPWLVFTILVFVLLIIGILVFLLIRDKIRFQSELVQLGGTEVVPGERETDEGRVLVERKKSLTYEDIRPVFGIFLDLDKNWNRVAEDNIDIRMKGLEEKFVNLYLPCEKAISNFCQERLISWLHGKSKKNKLDVSIIKMIEALMYHVTMEIREQIRNRLFDNAYYEGWKEVLKAIKISAMADKLTDEGVIAQAWDDYRTISLHRAKVMITTAKNITIEFWPDSLKIEGIDITGKDVANQLELAFWTDAKGNNLKDKDIEKSYILNEAANFSVAALEMDLHRKEKIDSNKKLLDKSRQEMADIKARLKQIGV